MKSLEKILTFILFLSDHIENGVIWFFGKSSIYPNFAVSERLLNWLF